MIKNLFIFLILCYLLIWLWQMVFCVIFTKLRVKEKSTNSASSFEGRRKHSKYKNAIICFANGLEKWTIRRVSRLPSHVIRKICFRYIFGIELGKRCVIYSESIFRRPDNIVIGEGTIIGDCCELDGRGGIKIGKNCNLSSEVRIWTAQHDPQGSDFDYVREPVTIGDKCWISSNTVILPGVNLGDGVVLAAGAVLTKNAEPYSIYAGVPAKKIADRNNNLMYSFDGSHDWFV